MHFLQCHISHHVGDGRKLMHWGAWNENLTNDLEFQECIGTICTTNES